MGTRARRRIDRVRYRYAGGGYRGSYSGVREEIMNRTGAAQTIHAGGMVMVRGLEGVHGLGQIVR